LLRQRNFVGSTLGHASQQDDRILGRKGCSYTFPFWGLMQGRLIFEVNWILGGASGY
jgi:hypothetical protein